MLIKLIKNRKKVHFIRAYGFIMFLRDYSVIPTRKPKKSFFISRAYGTIVETTCVRAHSGNHEENGRIFSSVVVGVVVVMEVKS